MKKMKIISVIIAATLVFSLFLSGCSGSTNNTSSSGNQTETPAPSASDSPQADNSGGGIVFGEDQLDITFYGHYDWYTMQTWGADEATKWIQDNKKVTVTAISSDGAAEQKLSTMILSNQLPDVIWLERGADVENLRANGMLVSFDEYIEKYPNLHKWAGDQTLDLLRSPDGKLYQFPNWYTGQPNGNTGYVVNKKIYTELGSPKLETTDDLYEYLKMVKGKYPDIVPLEVAHELQGVHVLASAFAENHPNLFFGAPMIGVPNEQTQTMESLFTNQVYREAMVYINKLFQEGLITPDALTQQDEQVQQKLITGRVAVYASASPTEYGSLGDSMLKAENPDDPDVGYFMIKPIHKAGLDQSKVTPGNYSSLGWNVAVITKSAKDPEAVFAFWDWMTGPEGQATFMWGPTGMFWDGLDENDVPKFNDRFVNDKTELETLMGVTSGFQWCGNSVWIDTSKMQFENTLPMEKRSWDTYYQSTITWASQYNASQFLNIEPAGDSDEGIIQATIREIFETAQAQMLLANGEAEVLAILDKAQSDAMAAGYEQILQFKTNKWHENLAMMS